MRSKYQKILIIKLAALGDTVLLTPALRAIRHQWPEAEIAMVCSPINRAVLKNCPYIDRLIEISPKPSKLPKLLGVCRQLRKQRFPIIFDFEQWNRTTALMALLIGAPERFGYDTPGQHRGAVYTTRIPHNRRRHELECFLELTDAAGVTRRGVDPEMWPSQADERRVDTLLRKLDRAPGPLVVIHPGSGGGSHPRQWDMKNYAQVADALTRDYWAQVILTGGPNEVDLAGEVASHMREMPLILAGRLSIGELAALARRANLFISGNTGPMHMAAAMNTPVVALHGPTDDAKWGPWGRGHRVIRPAMDCSPCLYLGFEYGCREYHCMRAIQPKEVLEAAVSLLQGPKTVQKTRVSAENLV